MYVRWFLYAIASLAFDIFVWLTSPLWALIAATFKLDRLPGKLAYVHTHDDDIYGSLTTREPIIDRWAWRFKRAVWWLCRNPGYGFDAHVIGFAGSDVVGTSTKGLHVDGGIMIRFLLKDGSKRWSYRRDLSYGSKSRYCKVSIGWNPSAQAGFHKLKITVNPWKSRK